MRQRVALVATLARLYVGVVLIDRECECRGHRRRIVGVVYVHMCQQQCDQRIGYAAGLRPGNMSQIGARSAYLAPRTHAIAPKRTTHFNHLVGKRQQGRRRARHHRRDSADVAG